MSDSAAAETGVLAALVAAVAALWAAFRGDVARLQAENALLRDRLEKAMIALAESRVRDEYEQEELEHARGVEADRTGGRGDRAREEGERAEGGADGAA